MWKKISAVLGAMIILGGLTTGVYFIEDRYAKAEDLNKEQTRLSVHVLQDQIQFIQNQQWSILDRCRVTDVTGLQGDSLMRYREYDARKKEMERKLESLMKEK